MRSRDKNAKRNLQQPPAISCVRFTAVNRIRAADQPAHSILQRSGPPPMPPATSRGLPMTYDDEFQLHDLRVEVIQSDDGKPMVCRHNVGDYFTVTEDDLLSIPAGQTFPMYSLAAILPLLPAKQRPLQANDWMGTDAIIACPDPNCGGRFLIKRGELKTYRHSEVTVTPLPLR
jgi:uncharacterized repeat protein (TIGR04076 family)